MNGGLRYYIVPLTTATGVLGFLLGGSYVWLGLATFPILMTLDIVLPRDFSLRRIRYPLLADLPLYLHTGLMFALYGAFLWSVNTGAIVLSGPGSAWQITGSVLSIGWLSTAPNLPVVHEFWHRRHWLPRRLGQILSTFFLDPNRDVGHVMTHHIYLDTAKDCDTAVRGENLYSFVYRATRGAYLDAIHSEAETMRRSGHSPWNWRNRSYQQLALLSVVLAVCWAVAGTMAVVVALLAMVMAKILVEAFNYFQHYGLLRVDGAPILKHHAWNHMGTIVRPLGLEISNHINHHLDGYTKFYDLRPEPDAPQMPSLFLCLFCALIPPVWFAFIAKPRLRDWDERYATPAERVLAMTANRKAGWPEWVATPAGGIGGARTAAGE